MAEMVFNSFPDEREGALARRYTALVCCDALARIAADIDLGTYLHMSEGEESSGGRDNLPLRPTPWKRSSRRSIWMVDSMPPVLHREALTPL